MCTERFGSGDGERKTLLTRQIAFEPLPAWSIKKDGVWDSIKSLALPKSSRHENRDPRSSGRRRGDLFLAIDLHARHSVLGVMDAKGRFLGHTRFPTTERSLAAEIRAIPEDASIWSLRNAR